ncbi:ATP-binding protein [bacterium]|nr:ATP-binding protein [candidate division CSSED10-310 bacterium]
MKPQSADFLRYAGRIINSAQARTLVLTGNIHDLFPLNCGDRTDYVPLTTMMTESWQSSNRIIIVYELNGPIRFLKSSERDLMRDAWLTWRTGSDANTLAIRSMLATAKVRAELETMQKTFDSNLLAAVGNPTVALELLRQLCLCSRSSIAGNPILTRNLIVFIEGADLLVPEGEISRLSDADRHRIAICQDWFSDPGFMNGEDAVVMTAESMSLINSRIARLPHVVEVPIGAPDAQQRHQFITWFNAQQPEDRKVQSWGSQIELARFAAGLSIHALMQMLKGAAYENRALTQADVIDQVQTYIQSQLGEDIVEFSKPVHSLKDVIGFSGLKKFLKKELIPRCRSTGADAISGAAVCGPIGGGKTFIFEAVAGELDMIVLVLKNIRSQWFGQTDVILERLRRVLDALAKVLIFVDEADTQFGGVGPETHDTERRLTGKIQAMMSDTRMRGRVIWLLMTARIHRLSPDIRRPGRVGDLIIPVLDPEGDDRVEFIRWMLKPVFKGILSDDILEEVSQMTRDFSAASFASIRSELKAHLSTRKKSLDFDEIREIINDHLSPAISETRRYQTLQALLNCTRRSLLPGGDVTPERRLEWERDLRDLERKGIH